jgi:hypothetical protein
LGHALIELGEPRSIVLIRLVADLFSNRIEMIIFVEPVGVAVSDEPKDRIVIG